MDLTKLRNRVLLVLLLAGFLGLPAAGDDLVEDVLPGGEVDGSLDPGEVHAYRLSLVAGTEVRLELDAEPDDDSPDAEPELVLIDPTEQVITPDASEPNRIRETTAVSGIHVVEVRAGGFEGDYRLEIRVELPDTVEDEVVISGGTGSVKLDAPVGSSVRGSSMSFRGRGRGSAGVSWQRWCEGEA